ncbi:MAG: hypothetical protein HYZ75_18575 [Elusimicrobia bacterium]|nr:hypothetical protein [Elusimicrobiota bacterium]
MAAPLVVYYVTDHGYGHATRAAAVAAALERRGARVALRTGVPAWLFADEGVAASVTAVDFDAGLVMKDALTVDIPASLLLHETLLARWDRDLETETAALRTLKPDAVISDAGALPLEAARRAGAPAVLAGNFAWDWIMEPWAAVDPRWEAVRRRQAQAYAAAELFLRMPLGGDGPSCRAAEDVPLVTRRPRMGRDAVRALIGVSPAETRPLVAFSLGGVPWESDGMTVHDLDGLLFVAYAARPAGLHAEWIQLPSHARVRHCDILAAADLALTKPGYGTFSELLMSKTPALVVERSDFRECVPLMENMRRLGRVRSLPRAEFEAGRWAEPLRELRAASDPWRELDASGDEAVAGRVLSLVPA